MERINVRSLNECFCIIGDDWINVSNDSYTVIKTVPSWNVGTKGLTTNSSLQKKIAKKNALKRNENYKGANNPRAKTWRIVYSDGREIVIEALQRWAIENGYSTSGIKNIAYGKWKKYKDLVTVEEVAQDPFTSH